MWFTIHYLAVYLRRRLHCTAPAIYFSHITPAQMKLCIDYGKIGEKVRALRFLGFLFKPYCCLLNKNEFWFRLISVTKKINLITAEIILEAKPGQKEFQTPETEFLFLFPWSTATIVYILWMYTCSREGRDSTGNTDFFTLKPLKTASSSWVMPRKTFYFLKSRAIKKYSIKVVKDDSLVIS